MYLGCVGQAEVEVGGGGGQADDVEGQRGVAAVGQDDPARTQQAKEDQAVAIAALFGRGEGGENG